MTGPTVLVCSDTDEFVEVAARWRPGQPFPLLPGPALRRYEELFAGDEPPAVPAVTRPGLVVSTGGRVAEAAAGLLAAATSRPHRHVAASELLAELSRYAGELVAVVGLAEDIESVGDWPGESGARVGVLATRTPQSLACLVYRTLTVDAAGGGNRVFVAAHPRVEDSDQADVIDFAGLAEVREKRNDVVVLRGLGKECSVALADGIVCGRSDAIDSPLPIFPVNSRLMPCLRGEGCFREDLTDDERLPAKDVHAKLVFTHGCSSVSLGTNVYPTHISLGLGLLDGTAVAVMGSMGVHIVQRQAQAELEAALSEGLPLGDVVHRLAERAYPINGWLNRFGLLGDPALVLRTPPRAATLTRTSRPDERVVRDLAHLNNVVLPRLDRLRRLELELDPADLRSLRRQLEAATEDLTDPELPGIRDVLVDEVADLQLRAVEDLVDQIFATGWNFGGPALDGMRQVDRRDVRCPNCGRDTAARLTLRHAVDEELVIQTLQCRRCGDVWWSTEPGEPTVSLLGPLDVDATRSVPVTLTREVRNATGHELTGGVGFAFNLRKTLGLPPPTSAPRVVPANGATEFGAHLDLVRYQPAPDVHTGVFVALLSGVYVASVTMMRLA
jgi:hypothetical protein